MSQWLVRIGCLLLLASLAACGSTPAKHGRSDSSGYRPVKSGKQSEQVIHVAKSMIGKPYKFGGASPRTGFDCSGLVYFSHQQNGITLPRSSYAQYRASRPVSRRALRRGDLLFFRISSNKVSHVGIYLGKNRFVHAPSRGKRVSIAQLDSPYWSKRFIRGGRI
jgi:cell wall-associated NlpC family hydrolase